MDVIVYPSATDKTKNRGFAFVEYESHKAAAMARRKLIPGIHTARLEMSKHGFMSACWICQIKNGNTMDAKTKHFQTGLLPKATQTNRPECGAVTSTDNYSTCV